MNLPTAMMQFWSERAPRERRTLAVGLGALAALLVYLLLIEPAASGIARLQHRLPQTRAQAGQLEALVSEAKGLRNLPMAALPGAGDVRSYLDKSLADAGLTVARKDPVAGADLRLVFVNVSFAKWSTWLAATERTLGMHASNVHIKGSGTPGNADIELTLRLARA
jgi:general secretion pathway protein M